MEPKVSIVMGSTSDLPVMEEAANILDKMEIPFEMHVFSAHRTPAELEAHVKEASAKGVQVMIAGAGGAAHLPGVIAAFTTLPVIGVPCRSSISLDGWDSVLSILQMPPGIPVATVGLDAARNAGILAVEIIALGDDHARQKLEELRMQMREKVLQSASALQGKRFRYQTNT
ncbi:MAG: 5-(carboxyamino)imidazole ribonucleotide mutase [Flavobacteriales bacterium]